jgi:hypothetical protein
VSAEAASLAALRQRGVISAGTAAGSEATAAAAAHRQRGGGGGGQRVGSPCTCERPNLAITRARVMCEWGNTREGWEGGYGVVWSDFFRIRHGCESDLESGDADLL